MNKNSIIAWSFIALIALFCLICFSVYTSPCIQGVHIENDFKNYYIEYFSGTIESNSDFKKRISVILNSIPRIRINTNASLEGRVWVFMFSGNENIALTSGAINFSYLIKNDKTSSIITLILFCIIYTSSYLVGVSTIWHNVLTYLMRLEAFPTKCFIRYYVQYTNNSLSNKNINQDDSVKVYCKFFVSFIPTWLIGFIIGYLNNDYDLYVKSPVIPVYLFIFLSVYCVCIGSLFVLSVNQIILYFFMRINVDVVTRYENDVICALLGIGISRWVFNNSLRTTIAVTIVSLFYTIVINNRTRSVNADDYEMTELAAIGYTNIGLYNQNKGKISNAINMYNQSISIYTYLGQVKDTAPVYGSLGKAYFDLGDLDNAEDALNRAIDLYELYQHDMLALKVTKKLLNLITERKQCSYENSKYNNSEFGFSLIIPSGWYKQKLNQKFLKTGGILSISHLTHKGTLNISVGPPDKYEWKNKEKREISLRNYLKTMPRRIYNVKINTFSQVAGKSNVVSAVYETYICISLRKQKQTNGLISIIHNHLEYAIQWTSEFDSVEEIKKIVNTFKFDN